jgi:hypothetical protein
MFQLRLVWVPSESVWWLAFLATSYLQLEHSLEIVKENQMHILRTTN